MLLPPLDPAPATFLEYVQAYNRIVYRGMRYARGVLFPAVHEERRAYQADDASTIAAYIDELRRELGAAEALARDAVTSATTAAGARHTARWTATIASSANIDVSLLVRDDDLIEMLSYRVQEHVGLIRSLSTDMATRIERLALGSILEGRGNRETAKMLTEIEGIGRNRAKLIARDQANKLNGALNQFRQEQAGITHYKWLTTLDGRERPTHHANNGKVFAWSRPPATNHPGYEIHCRCRAAAIVFDDDEDLPRGEGEPPPDDIIEAEAPRIRRVGNILGESVLQMGAEAIAARKADVSEVRAILASLKGASDALTNDLERMFALIYGYDAPSDLGRGGLFGSSRASQLRSAIKERIDIIGDLLDHATRY